MTSIALVSSLAFALLPIDKSASVRVINAVADREQLAFSVGDGVWEGVPYGQRTRFEEIPVESKLIMTSVLQRRGEKIANDVPIRLQPGFPHTVIFTGRVTESGNFTPIVLRDTTAGRPSSSSVQIQFVNAISDRTAVTITLNDALPQKRSKIDFGDSTPFIGYDSREYELKLLDMKKSELYTTKLRAFGGTRYVVVAMGTVGGTGNRAPRLFVYTF